MASAILNSDTMLVSDAGCARSRRRRAFLIIMPTEGKTYKVTPERLASNSVKAACASSSDGSCCRLMLVHTTLVHSATHGILH